MILTLLAGCILNPNGYKATRTELCVDELEAYWATSPGPGYTAELEAIVDRCPRGFDDIDLDGVPLDFDCDDTDPRRRPGTRAQIPFAPQDRQDWEDPDWMEVPYDGIDNDCSNGDLVDADGDLFPGITREAHAIASVEAGLYATVADVPWPANVFDTQLDCDDANAAVFPSAPDEPYNGLDEDCAGDNDFDRDGDGQMRQSEDPAVVAAYVAATGIFIDLDAPYAFGDCMDLDPAVFGGNPVDPPYDGEDSDCAGDNDFDRDGDGYRPDGFDAAFQVFVDRYHPTVRPAWFAGSQAGDCLDLPTASLPGVDPAEVNPGIVDDVPSDGVDADCAGDNDFDADGDGYSGAADPQQVEDYNRLWSEGEPPGWQPTVTNPTALLAGDCDDQDASVAPGMLEVLGDLVDSDCDGLDDGTPFAYASMAWDKPTWPRIVRNDVHYLVTTNARWSVRRTPTSSAVLPNAAVNVFFSADPTDPGFPGYRAEPLNVRPWANANPSLTDPRSPGLDMVSAGSTMFIGNSSYTESNGIFKMGFVQRTFSPLLNDYADVHLANRINVFDGFETDAETTFIPDAGASQPTQGWLWMTSCGGAGRAEPYASPQPGEQGVLRQMVIRTPFTTVPASQVVPLSPDAAGGGQIALAAGRTADVCWHEVEAIDSDTLEATVQVCDIDGCSRFESSVVGGVGSFAPSVDPSPYDGRGVIEADVHGDLLVLVEAAGVVIEAVGSDEAWALFVGEPVISADAMATDDGMLYVAAVVEAVPLNELRLAYGPSDDLAAWTTVVLPVTDDDPVYLGGVGCNPATGLDCVPGRVLEPRRVGLHADEQRVAVVVSAWTPADYVPADPDYVVGSTAQPGRQDAVGWAFFEPAAP